VYAVGTGRKKATGKVNEGGTDERWRKRAVWIEPARSVAGCRVNRKVDHCERETAISMLKSTLINPRVSARLAIGQSVQAE
jgi:hypothetical protein